MWRLNIPVACAAVRGELGKGVLGKAFDQCVALVSLMLTGSGSVDLLLIAKSGDVAIGEAPDEELDLGLAQLAAIAFLDDDVNRAHQMDRSLPLRFDTFRDYRLWPRSCKPL